MPKIKMNNETIELVTVSRKQLDIPWLIQMSWIVTFSGQNIIWNNSSLHGEKQIYSSAAI